MNVLEQKERHRVLKLPGNAKAQFWLQMRGDKVELHHSYQLSTQGGSGGTGGWNRCADYGCLGEATALGGRCLAHLDPDNRAAHLHTVRANTSLLSLRGVVISQSLWDEIAASTAFEGGAPAGPMSLAGAESNARITINAATFNHYFDLTGASVNSPLELTRCTFKSSVLAPYAVFDAGPPNLSESLFFKDVDLSFAEAIRVSFGFDKCTFQGALKMDGIRGGVQLSGSTIEGNLTARHADAHLIANGVTLRGTFDVVGAEGPALHCQQLVAESVARIGPCGFKNVYLQGANFESRVYVDLAAELVDFSGAALDAGGLLVVSGTASRIELSQLSLGGPLRIAGKGEPSQLPEVVSLQNADAGQLAFARVDMSRCSFYGAHGLGTIDIESTVKFATRAKWIGRRRFIADEFAWRASTNKPRTDGWELTGVVVGEILPRPPRGEREKVLLPPLSAEQVAAIYRDLRRSLESKSDMPSAADFYYGEMEMRKWSRNRSWVERALIWGYWGTAGYGLRPARALVAWLVLVSVGALLLSQGGLEARSYSTLQVWATAVRLTLPGVTAGESLTAFGRLVEVLLRVGGALSIALFVISARTLIMRKPGE